MRTALALLIAASPLFAACINTDTAVFVAGTLDGAGATLTQAPPFGVSVTGGAFHLKLHLGARASGPSMVTLGSFALLDAQKEAAIDAPMLVDSAPTSFPVTVEPDSDEEVDFKFDSGKAVLAADLQEKLCDPAGVIIRGTLEDSLQNTPTTLYSDAFHLEGCN